jgi:hypothetical protein
MMMDEIGLRWRSSKYIHLDEIQDNQWGTVSLEEIVKVLPRGNIIWVGNSNYRINSN